VELLYSGGSLNGMTKNPLINALVGLLYISCVASLLFYAAPHIGIENTVLIPIAMLSLFVFSAATMGYVFLYEPLQLFIDGKKKEAVTLFLRTLFIFAAVTVAFVLVGIYVTLVW
jgi:hypothetical protein